ncbi:MAG: sulfate adenylyltransferase subunit CysN [Bryobacterales bacterium]|nr:sulfate adenylyltransferase subunit CysN [Bryobacterales bacterium]
MAAIAQPQTLSLSHFELQPGEKSILRFSTAGSVDDGKSTLIGRLLFDSRGAFDDQIEAVRKSPINRSSGAIDFSLLTDGLRAEREQGITIDVAYRYFSTSRRKFIIADTPGHEQYTRNMATGASTADAAVILVDARKGVLPQSRRHASISALLGIRHLIIAVNKMDLAGYSRSVFDAIRRDFEALSPALRHPWLTFIPVSALEGDNVVERSPRMAWYQGPALLEFLENLDVDSSQSDLPARFPVQYVIRPHLDFRGFAGQLASGWLATGDRVVALPSGHTSRIKEIVTFDGHVDRAFAPMSVTVTLEDEIDISRGDVLTHVNAVPELGRRVEATLVWMSAADLETGKTYLLRHGPNEVPARVTEVINRLDVDTLTRRPAGALRLNDIGLASLEFARPVAFDCYHDNRRTGAFVLVDPLTNLTLAAGMIERRLEAQRRRPTASFIADRVTPPERTEHFGHTAAVVTLASRPNLLEPLERMLFELGAHVVVMRQPVSPLNALLEAGLLVLTPLRVPGALSAGSLQLPDDSEAACKEILEYLRGEGILRTRSEYDAGEGI